MSLRRGSRSADKEGKEIEKIREQVEQERELQKEFERVESQLQRQEGLAKERLEELGRRYREISIEHQRREELERQFREINLARQRERPWSTDRSISRNPFRLLRNPSSHRNEHTVSESLHPHRDCCAQQTGKCH
jgi:hypothetical protein